jgi:O-antigen ligase
MHRSLNRSTETAFNRIGREVILKLQWIDSTRGKMPFWLMLTFLVIVFLLGGGSRADIQSLVILRPVAVIFLTIAILGLSQTNILENRFLFWVASATVVLVGVQLVPLPPSIWQSFPGRSIVIEADRAASLGPIWRPISLVPDGTWNALYSLVVPLTALAFMAQMDRDSRFRLLPYLIGVGLISGLVGVLQAIGPRDGMLYLYEVTTNGSAVGLFANRNHQAVFLATLFPMLAVYASNGVRSQEESRVRLWLSVCAALVIVPLLLVTGSRAGIIAGAIGLASVPLLYRKPNVALPRKRKVGRLDPTYLIATIGVLLIGAFTWLAARAQAFERLLSSDNLEELRFRILGTLVTITGKYFPVGSGFGSFVEVYQIDEPDQLLDMVYVNHAHNDWLETIMTGGLFGALLLAVVVIAWTLMSLRVFRMPLNEQREPAFARLGLVIILMMGLASLADYPLRVPSLAFIFVIAAFWASVPGGTRSKNAGTV